jgi:hypothetical protein
MQICLDNALPFQSLDDLEYELKITRGRTFSQDDMDRITQLSFNPFQLSINDLELCGISAHPDSSFDIDKIKCDYYLTNEQKRCHHKRQTKNYFSLLHLNIRSVSKNFDSFKHLLNSQGKPIKVIGLTETWLNDTNNDNFNIEKYDFISSNRSNKKGGGVGIYIIKETECKIRKDLNSVNEDGI